MNFIKRNIPNAITCGNLLCGCLAIVKAFEGNLVWAAYLVGIAAVLDFFDGFAARLLKVSSPIGKDLDSLADMVTFGVVPGVLVYQLIKMTIPIQNYEWGVNDDFFGHYNVPSKIETYLPYLGFIISIFSGIRLAKFNNDARQSDSFIGLPTPANAIFISSLVLLVECGESLDGSVYPSMESVLVLQYWILIPLVILLSFLLVAELPLFSLKFKHFKWKGNEIRFVFLLLSVVMLVLLKFLGISLTIIFYILLSVVSNIMNKKKAA